MVLNLFHVKHIKVILIENLKKYHLWNFYLFVAIVFSGGLTFKADKKSSNIYENPLMCSNISGKCMGKSYCTACSNCSRCGYCNSGGSCGVCARKPSKYVPKKWATIPEKSILKQSNSTPTSLYQSAYLPKEIFTVVEKTSLRIAPNAKSAVLQRLDKNNRLQMVDATSQKYWCKVICDGRVGWVKTHLLERVSRTKYP